MKKKNTFSFWIWNGNNLFNNLKTTFNKTNVSELNYLLNVPHLPVMTSILDFLKSLTFVIFWGTNDRHAIEEILCPFTCRLMLYLYETVLIQKLLRRGEKIIVAYVLIYKFYCYFMVSESIWWLMTSSYMYFDTMCRAGHAYPSGSSSLPL